MSPLKSKTKKDGKSSVKSEHTTKSIKKTTHTITKQKSVTPKDKTKTLNEVTKTQREGRPTGPQVTYKRIKLFTLLFILVAAVLIFLSLDLLLTAVHIRARFGAYLNMISAGEGEVLPALLAIPVFIALALDIAIIVFTYKLFSDKKDPQANKILFLLIAAALGTMVLTLVIIFATLGHAFGSSKHVEDGILEAMGKYAISSYHKKQIDRLQIEFQCCGSRKYEDWYNISWTDEAMSPSESIPSKTPFSCCAIKSKFPCIHHAIDCIGLSYNYVPEFNLSISSTGCHAKIIKKKRIVGITIVANLFLFIFLEVLMLVPARFLQTAHSTDYKFDGTNKFYTLWLFGSNPAPGPPQPPENDQKVESGGTTPDSKQSKKSVNKEHSSKETGKNKGSKVPPAVPPVPLELRT